MAANSANAPGRRNLGRPWQKGQSGNPRGRPKSDFEIQALAREYTMPAIQALVKALGDPRYRVSAAMGLLAYGYGRPQAANDEELPGNVARTFVLKIVMPENSSVNGVSSSVNRANGATRLIGIPAPANDDD